MSGLLDRATRWVGAVNRGFAALASVLVVILMLVVVQDVARRSLLGVPSLWALDVARILLTHIFFLALAPALWSGSHVSVDLLANLWPPRARRLMPRLAALLSLAFALILFWFVWHSVARDFEDGGLAQAVFPIERKWIVAIGVVGCGQFVLTAALMVLRPAPPRATEG